MDNSFFGIISKQYRATRCDPNKRSEDRRVSALFPSHAHRAMTLKIPQRFIYRTKSDLDMNDSAYAEEISISKKHIGTL